MSSGLLNVLALAGLGLTSAHTVFMCIDASAENEIVAYAGTYHTNSKVGGMIIAGGEVGNEQFGARCPQPYAGFQSGSYAGEVPCSYTRNGAQTWACGDRFNWEVGPAMSFAQVVAQAPTANCDQVGTAATVSNYRTTDTSITWSRVTIPVNSCGPGIYYDLVTTADSCDDTPWMNVWATIECVEGDFTDVITDDPECAISGVTCPAATTVSANSQCAASVDVAGGATVTSSDCSALTTTAQSQFPVGTTTVTVTAEDGAESATCQTSVTVVDDSAPVLGALDNVVVAACGGDYSQASTGVPTATDNCAATVSPSDSIVAGSCGNNFDIVRTWTATDPSGNQSSFDQIISVRDESNPTVAGVNDFSATCGASAYPPSVTGTPAFDDDCSGATLEYSDVVDQEPGSCAAEFKIFRTWTATDACGNASNDFVQVITVEDNAAPTIAAPADVIVACTADTSVAALGAATATDSCSDVSMSFNDVVVEGSCPNNYQILRTWTATDACGNVSSHLQTITVQDNTAPVQAASTENGICLWPPNHKYACFGVESDSFVAGSDNCGTVDISFSECASSQPIEVNQGGDGNTYADCFYDAETDEICFRAERQGKDKAGRFYTASFTAADQCGNSAVFARDIHVPHSGKNAQECVEPGTSK